MRDDTKTKQIQFETKLVQLMVRARGEVRTHAAALRHAATPLLISNPAAMTLVQALEDLANLQTSYLCEALTLLKENVRIPSEMTVALGLHRVRTGTGGVS
ncbi:MAG TPA: hypothetical protein VM597_30980 [Gemmataceae bacterium]|jgi:hypothetical protein|nr:hypothetical protein [Gemmataceae bacterium]